MTNKVCQVVFVGGKFTDGSHILDCLQDMCTYFGTIHNLQLLIYVHVLYIVPVVIIVFGDEIWVLSVKNPSRTAIIHHCDNTNVESRSLSVIKYVINNIMITELTGRRNTATYLHLVRALLYKIDWPSGRQLTYWHFVHV